MTRTIINQVRELLERNLNLMEIADRLSIDLETVKIAAHIVKEIIT
jgi:hypothetical protein